jgi:hypothetical protein
MRIEDFIKWMIEQGLSSRVERSKCLNTYREEGFYEAKKEAIERIEANKPKPYRCCITGMEV